MARRARAVSSSCPALTTLGRSLRLLLLLVSSAASITSPAWGEGAGTKTSTRVPSSANVEAGYRRLDAFTQGLQSLEADFRQTLRDGRGRVVEESEGTLSLMRPGRFRWDYRKPHVVQVVSDGTHLWQYDQDLQQATVRAVDNSLADTPAMLLSGQGSLRDSFVVTGTEVADGLSWVVLRPKRADTDFRMLRLGFEGLPLGTPGSNEKGLNEGGLKNSVLKAMELADKLGQTTTLEFLQVRRNPPLNDGRFDFKAPAGVDVIGGEPVSPISPSGLSSGSSSGPAAADPATPPPVAR